MLVAVHPTHCMAFEDGRGTSGYIRLFNACESRATPLPASRDLVVHPTPRGGCVGRARVGGEVANIPCCASPALRVRRPDSGDNLDVGMSSLLSCRPPFGGHRVEQFAERPSDLIGVVTRNVFKKPTGYETTDLIVPNLKRYHAQAIPTAFAGTAHALGGG